jgi:hypothetical protein
MATENSFAVLSTQRTAYSRARPSKQYSHKHLERSGALHMNSKERIGPNHFKSRSSKYAHQMGKSGSLQDHSKEPIRPNYFKSQGKNSTRVEKSSSFYNRPNNARSRSWTGPSKHLKKRDSFQRHSKESIGPKIPSKYSHQAEKNNSLHNHIGPNNVRSRSWTGPSKHMKNGDSFQRHSKESIGPNHFKGPSKYAHQVEQSGSLHNRWNERIRTNNARSRSWTGPMRHSKNSDLLQRHSKKSIGPNNFKSPRKYACQGAVHNKPKEPIGPNTRSYTGPIKDMKKSDSFQKHSKENIGPSYCKSRSWKGHSNPTHHLEKSVSLQRNTKESIGSNNSKSRSWKGHSNPTHLEKGVSLQRNTKESIGSNNSKSRSWKCHSNPTHHLEKSVSLQRNTKESIGSNNSKSRSWKGHHQFEKKSGSSPKYLKASQCGRGNSAPTMEDILNKGDRAMRCLDWQRPVFISPEVYQPPPLSDDVLNQLMLFLDFSIRENPGHYKLF